MPHDIPSLPCGKVASDILTFAEKDFLSTIVDYCSKWVDRVELKYKTASEIISKTMALFSSNSIPKTFIADNMPFNSLELINFAKQWNFIVTTSSPFYPKGVMYSLCMRWQWEHLQKVIWYRLCIVISDTDTRQEKWKNK